MLVETAAVLISTMLHRATLIEEALERAGWTIVTYHKVPEALAHLRERPFAAVFCDEVLRGGSVAGFLSWSRRVARPVPFYVIGEGATLRHPRDGLAPDGVIAFPPDAATLPRPPHASLWDAPAPLDRDLPMEGRTAPGRVVEVLEMLALDAASATIAFASGTRGSLTLREGHLVDAAAVAGDLEAFGVQALARLLTLDDVAFQVLPYRAPQRRTVHVPIATAIDEALALGDELRQHAGLLQVAREHAPDATALAVGYVLAERPSDVIGDGSAAFAAAVALLDAAKRAVGSVSHVSVEADGRSIAAVRVRNDHVLAGIAPRGRSVALLSALARAVKERGRAGSAA